MLLLDLKFKLIYWIRTSALRSLRKVGKYLPNIYQMTSRNGPDLSNSRQRHCENLKCTIVPVIIGVTGIVTRSLRKNLEALPGKHSIDSLQKTAILGTSHIIRKVLQCEAYSLSGGDHRWFKRSTRNKRPVTRDIHIIIIILLGSVISISNR